MVSYMQRGPELVYTRLQDVICIPVDHSLLLLYPKIPLLHYSGRMRNIEKHH